MIKYFGKKQLLSYFTIRRQLIIGIASVHAIMMSIFVFDLVDRQHKFLNNQSADMALSLSQTLGINSVSWVLSNDFIGMEEIIQSLNSYPEIKYAMLLNPEGKILAHTQKKFVGFYISDSISLSILNSNHASNILIQNQKLIDVATPIINTGKIIGWSRIAIKQEMIEAGLRNITIDGIWYTLLAILVGSVFAILMARGITKGLHELVIVTNKVRDGNENARVIFIRPNELGVLANNLNIMLDSLVNRKQEIENAKQEIALARDIAENASKAKGMFLANMSHELRTPLNGILGFTQLFKKNRSLPSDVQPGIEVIHKSAQHLLMLVNDILDFSKMDTNHIKIKEELFLWQDFILPITELYKVQANHKYLDFVYQVDPKLPKAFIADKFRLKQVLLNLLSNSIKFTEKGFVKLIIELKETEPNTDDVLVKFSILDTGIGIAKDKQQIIFDPFQQISSVHQFIEGTGLGLSITKKIIELFGSNIQVESPIRDTEPKPEGTIGTVFYFELKMKLAYTIPISESVEETSDMMPMFNAECAKYNILVVDDSKTSRIVLSDFLRNMGFSCTEADNGKTAIELCRQTAFHLLFIDLFMPELNGCETIQQIIEQNLLHGQTIIYSAYADITPNESANCNAILKSGFLAKPFHFNDLIALLKKYLHLSFPKYIAKSITIKEKIIHLPEQAKLLQLLQYSKTGDISALKKMLLSLMETENGKYNAFALKMSKMADFFEFDKIESFINEKLSERENYNEK